MWQISDKFGWLAAKTRPISETYFGAPPKMGMAAGSLPLFHHLGVGFAIGINLFDPGLTGY